ncbi:hypothetical protein M2371_002861 [Buttiauxella sp. BIGb0471]|uniref:hypothetical protein n=1 Tax=Buttiauxella sp. BIGb0471 TaxID=2940597 RepID=UPI0021699B6A|nr:hypothetical protein [Buttiauxella sp. BIGb0471]MCS3603626.1 hypothetical protein [Buttiauxella sp. BIGb0471]
MNSETGIAEELYYTINGETPGVVSGFIEGILEIPEDIGYIAYDFIDSENRYNNNNDKIRLMFLVKKGGVNKDSLAEIIKVILIKYYSLLTNEQKSQLQYKIGGQITGKLVFTTQALSKFLQIFIDRLLIRTSVGLISTSLVTLGAMQSKAVYSSRDLLNRNPNIYWELRGLGDLDLLYFILEDKLKSFEDAILLHDKDRSAFNNVMKHYADLVHGEKNA